MRSHSMDNGADKVGVEDAVDVNHVEQHGNAEKPQTPQPSHDEENVLG